MRTFRAIGGFNADLYAQHRAPEGAAHPGREETPRFLVSIPALLMPVSIGARVAWLTGTSTAQFGQLYIASSDLDWVNVRPYLS